jgi:hypothetical protein
MWSFGNAYLDVTKVGLLKYQKMTNADVKQMAMNNRVKNRICF